MGAGLGLGHRHVGVEVERGVVVDVAVVVEQPAVAVVGVLVEAQVGHDHDVVAQVAAQVAQGHLHDPVGVPRLGARGVLAGGDAEQDERPHAEVDLLVGLLAQRLAGVLHDAREAGDLAGLVDALADEERGDQVAGAQAGLGDQVTKGRGAPQTAEPLLRERHHRPGYVPSPTAR